VVEDLSPFCPSCGVPQIRFSAREPTSDATVTRAGASPPGVSSSGSHSSYVRVEANASITRRAGGLDRQAAVRSALNAGAAAGILSLLPLGFIVAMPLAGFLAVRLYCRRSSLQETTPVAGFRLGALCGAFGFVIFTALTAVITLASHAQNEFRGVMMEAVRRAQARNPDPQARQVFDYFTSQQGLIVMLVLGFVFVCVVFVLLSGLGGAISAAMLRRKGPSA